jgi:hypothetical protein
MLPLIALVLLRTLTVVIVRGQRALGVVHDNVPSVECSPLAQHDVCWLPP